MPPPHATWPPRLERPNPGRTAESVCPTSNAARASPSLAYAKSRRECGHYKLEYPTSDVFINCAPSTGGCGAGFPTHDPFDQTFPKNLYNPLQTFLHASPAHGFSPNVPWHSLSSEQGQPPDFELAPSQVFRSVYMQAPSFLPRNLLQTVERHCPLDSHRAPGSCAIARHIVDLQIPDEQSSSPLHSCPTFWHIMQWLPLSPCMHVGRFGRNLSTAKGSTFRSLMQGSSKDPSLPPPFSVGCTQFCTANS